MELLYFRVPGGNFGDDMNEWLWDRLLPGWRGWTTDTALMGVGTILKRGFIPEDRRKLVIGAGSGYGITPVVSADPKNWDVRAVRGPLTASAIGVPQDLAVIDPAALVSDFDEFRHVARNGQTLFVPHHGTGETFDWTRICWGTGITPLSPAGDAETVVRRIAGARRVIAESLHAAIIADTFRVPWQAVSIGNGFNQFKWADWGQSLDMEIKVTPFFARLRKLQSRRPDNSQPTGTRGLTPNAEFQHGADARQDHRRNLKHTVKYGLLGATARASLISVSTPTV